MSAEDIFTSALEGLFNEVPVTVPTAHGTYTHERNGKTIVIRVPETQAENWGLQADGVWQASVYLADHLPDLGGKRVLELGAAAGLPGIVAAFGTRDPPARVVLSDYPDKGILSGLAYNVETNQGDSVVPVEVVGHAWGQGGLDGEFDVVLAADVVWMGEMHEALCMTLDRVLAPGGRVHIVAGMHTGRGVVASFLATAVRHKLHTSEVYEVQISSGLRREWCEVRAGESMDQRRGWLVVAVLVFVDV